MGAFSFPAGVSGHARSGAFRHLLGDFQAIAFHDAQAFAELVDLLRREPLEHLDAGLLGDGIDLLDQRQCLVCQEDALGAAVFLTGAAGGKALARYLHAWVCRPQSAKDEWAFILAPLGAALVLSMLGSLDNYKPANEFYAQGRVTEGSRFRVTHVAKRHRPGIRLVIRQPGMPAGRARLLSAKVATCGSSLTRKRRLPMRCPFMVSTSISHSPSLPLGKAVLCVHAR